MSDVQYLHIESVPDFIVGDLIQNLALSMYSD